MIICNTNTYLVCHWQPATSAHLDPGMRRDDARTVIVEGEKIAYLVLDQDGKVQKLHPAYNLDDEPIGEAERAVVVMDKTDRLKPQLEVGCVAAGNLF